jgi:hypothetical protein
VGAIAVAPEAGSGGRTSKSVISLAADAAALAPPLAGSGAPASISASWNAETLGKRSSGSLARAWSSTDSSDASISAPCSRGRGGSVSTWARITSNSPVPVKGRFPVSIR